jgi:uncharacterized membrane protein YgcG
LALGLWLGLTCIIQAQDDSTAAPPAPDSVPPSADSQAPYAPPAPDADQGQARDASAPTGPMGPSVTFQTFYDSLGNYGTWIQTDTYGYVWQPTITDPNWAPYTDGRWVYSNDGWTWDSDEPFGWAVYHYGRWVNLDGIGWAWVPGYTWAPAWVSWRYGDGYVGWAPLPPDSFAGIDYFGDGYDPDYGFHIGGDADDFYGIGPILYVFLPIGCVGYHDYHHWYHNRNDNFALINHTTNVTNINVTRGRADTAARVTTGGPVVSQVDAASQDPVPRVSLARASRPGASTLSGNTLSVFAPRVTAAAGSIRPSYVSSAVNVAGINRGTDINRPLTVNPRLAVAPATEDQIAVAHDSAGRAPASAKVLTDASTVKPVFSTPLTSLQPANAAVAPVTTNGRTFNIAPGTVYNHAGENSVFGPVHMPSTTTEGETPSVSGNREVEQVAPQRIYNPTTVYTPHYSPGATPTTPGAPTYVHVTPAPSYSPAATHVAPSSESSGGYSGGHSSGGGSVQTSGGSSGSGAGAGNGRSH